ncbi:But2 family protein But2 [Schizosaccharomyces japonicus yFS275]|uniref:But2 family protein But2 n=1 Tax=Schizosaccharomyces japonicus (strain yFS275 / FY16936) TaxID=402676 RepID=B6JZ24_SCHJY|nr:But2 family protein But2 [Schizosaccharomyces japonicus yFS275]EEB06792.1 But2 family protein But2 [Schizosaccharomyces japonicus yFS275]
MQYFTSLLGAVSMLATAVSAAPVPFWRRADSVAAGVGVNQTFGVISYANKVYDVDWHAWYVSPTSGQVYIGPSGDATTPGVFYIDEDTYLRNSGAFAYSGDNKEVAFTNHTNYWIKQHNDGSNRVDTTQKKPVDQYTANKAHGKYNSYGYTLQRAKKNFIYCGNKVYTGAGRSSDCEDFEAVALNLSTWTPTYRNTTVNGVRQLVPTIESISDLSADVPAKSERLAPQAIRQFNYQDTTSKSDRAGRTYVSNANGANRTTIYTYNLPFGDSSFYYTSCSFEIRLTQELFPLEVSPSNGTAQFVIYNMTGNPTDGTTSRNTPTRLDEVTRFNCSMAGCHYSMNVACPRAGHAHSYEIVAASKDTTLAFTQTSSPIVGMSMFVYSDAIYD